MNLFYGIAVVVRLMFALTVGDKTGTAYLWYLLQELVGVNAERKEDECLEVVTSPEQELTPSRG